ncbi:MAG: MAPEG family protein [Proteobacteria bacterium]|nr:MAPEG family protein [Pseudomonadota bacterium]
MHLLSFDNPVFVAYAASAALLALKYLGQGWATVVAMISTDSGLMNPEDFKKTPFNANPRPEQAEEAGSVGRSRRMHRNDTENLPPFFAIGLLFVLAEPSLMWARILLYGVVGARFGHALAYATGQIHEVRAGFFSLGSLLTMGMAGWVLWTALS